MRLFLSLVGLLAVDAAVGLNAENLLTMTYDGCVIVYTTDDHTIRGYADRLDARLQFVELDRSQLTALLTVDHPYVSIKVLNSTGGRYSRALSSALPREVWAIAPLRRHDRACLLQPTHSSVPIRLLDGHDRVLDVINEQCQSYWTREGERSDEGKVRDALLDGRFGLLESENPRGEHPPLECEYIDEVPSSDDFFERYLSVSKPVVIRAAVRERWKALEKWSNDWLRSQFGSRSVHVKLTPPVGVFEGVERIDLWPSATSIPAEVRRQLVSDDVVLVRPAGVQITFNELIDLVEKREENASFVSAYLEYTSLKDFLTVLRDDAPALDFMDDLLVEQHRNVWLSDGNTLGKLHYDEFDNLLVMVDGKKTVRLYSPWKNRRLYEGHIVEAQLAYVNGSFVRGELMQSTAMTMSPIDILRDTSTFPLFHEAPTTECVIETGDALYLPAFWWHEVQSAPSDNKRNLAINFWYSPFFNKEFPCADCPFDVNSLYRHLLHKSKHMVKN